MQGQRPNIILSRLLTSLMFTELPNSFPQLTMAKLTLTLNSLLSFIRRFGLFMENCFTHFFFIRSVWRMKTILKAKMNSGHVIVSFLVFQGIIAVLVYGIVFYPFFACLTTEYKLVGSLLGFVYGVLRYVWVIDQ